MIKFNELDNIVRDIHNRNDGNKDITYILAAGSLREGGEFAAYNGNGKDIMSLIAMIIKNLSESSGVSPDRIIDYLIYLVCPDYCINDIKPEGHDK